MTFAEIANAIRSRFQTQIEEGQSVTVKYDNEDANQAPDGEKWIRFTILEGQSFQMDLGSNKTFRNPGVAVAQIFVPAGHGTKDAEDLADAIRTAFRAQAAGGVTYQTPYLAPVGNPSNGDWWQLNVNCPYFADDTES
jgi:hypothetical protein